MMLLRIILKRAEEGQGSYKITVLTVENTVLGTPKCNILYSTNFGSHSPTAFQLNLSKPVNIGRLIVSARHQLLLPDSTLLAS